MELFGAAGVAWTEGLRPGVVWLHGFALAQEAALAEGLEAVLAAAPWRHMETPMGPMSVAMTNAGPWGWVGDRQGYRYAELDPLSGQPWPPIPPAWLALAQGAADAAGLGPFTPDACLVNRYAPSTRMGLHRDRDEADFSHPIVSVSLGLPATFLLGGAKRSDPTQGLQLVHGDVLVWGGPERLVYHGVRPVKAGQHPWAGACRVNLTFRKAGA